MSDVATALLQLTGRAEPAADPALAAVKLARASLDALILRLGQSLDARVTAQLAGGLTQLTSGGETFVLKLETPLPVNTAVTLKLTPTAVTVTVQPQPPVAPPAPPAPLPAPTLPQPVAAKAARPASALPAAPPPTPLAPPPLSAPPTAATPVPPSTAPLAPATPTPAQAQPPTSIAQTPAIPAPRAIVQSAAAPTPVPQVALQPAPARTPAPAAEAFPPVPAPPAPARPAPAQPAPVSTIATPPGQQATLPAVSTPPLPVAAPTQPAAAQSPRPAPIVLVANSAAKTSSSLPPVPQPTTSAAPAVLSGPSPALAPPLVPASISPPAPPAVAPAASLPPPTAVPPPSHSRPPQPASPPLAQILADPVQAAARQDSVLPLIARLATLAAPTAAALPRPALEAIAMLLGTRLDLNRASPDGKAIRDAVLRAGVITQPGTRTPSDIKSALLQLRSALSGFLGGEVEAIAPVTRRPPPPLQGEPVRAPTAQPAPPLAEEPVEAARQLLGHADAALARVKLLQLASNPADPARPNIAAPTAEFRVEVPMQLGAESGILQLLVERDGKHKRSPAERGWRMRFALTFTATGEVGAEVALLGRSANVSLWAADPAIADALEAMLPELAPALARHGLEVGAVRVRRGAPQPAARSPGRLLDTAR